MRASRVVGATSGDEAAAVLARQACEEAAGLLGREVDDDAAVGAGQPRPQPRRYADLAAKARMGL
nr:hypothetical protein [Tepidiforma sp.]